MVYIWKKKKLLLFNRLKQQQDIDCNNFLQKDYRHKNYT